MSGKHHPIRFIGSNWKNRKVEGSKQLSDLFENFAVGRVSRIENLLSFRSFDDEASPKPSISLAETPFGPMANWNKSNLKLMSVDFDISFFGPIHLNELALGGKGVL